MSNRKNGNGKDPRHEEPNDLAAFFGRKFAESLRGEMPTITEVVSADDDRQATFSATITFKPGKDSIVASMTPRLRTPLERVEYKLRLNDEDQLELFGDGPVGLPFPSPEMPEMTQ